MSTKYVVINESNDVELAEFVELTEACEYAMAKWREGKKVPYSIKNKTTQETVSRIGILLG